MSDRELNVDLFRIIAALLVIVLHVLGQGGILHTAVPGTLTYWVAWLMEIGAYCAVNCFALISGYVMVNREPKLRSIINLWFQVLFYSLSFSFLFFVFVPGTRSLKNLVVAFLPVLGNQWWYISSYFALFFFIPVLNTAVAHITKKEFEKLLAVILTGVCIMDCIIPIDAFVLYDGYSPIWLIVLYLFGAYIKKYDLKQKFTAMKSLLGYIAMIVLTFLSKFVIYYATGNLMGEVKYDNTFISYTSITIVPAAIFLFMFCLNHNSGKYTRKAVSFLSPAALGVYLIHVHPLVFAYVVKDAFVSFAGRPVMVMILCVLMATVAIFALCAAVELLRIRLFRLVRINRLCEIIDNKMEHLFSKAFK